MKKIVCILSVMVLVSASFAANKDWTNGSGDRNFARGSNWFDTLDTYNWVTTDTARINMSGTNAPILNSNVTCGSMQLGYIGNGTGQLSITGGTNTFVSCTFAGAAGSTGLLNVSGGNTTFSGFFTVGNAGVGVFEISDGVVTVNRSLVSQNLSAQGQYIISGGVMNVATYLTVGSNGQGDITMTGGTLNVNGGVLKLADVAKASQGTITMSGDSVINVPASYVVVGEDGRGILNLNGGTFNCVAMGLGYVDDPNSQGYVNVTDGTINANAYITVGTNGKAQLNISGGAVNANRMTLAQGAIGETYPTTGNLTISGGQINLKRYLQVGRDGAATLTVVGNTGEVNIVDLEINGLSTAKFILNGAAGVGGGVKAFASVEMDGLEEVINEGDLLFNEGAAIDADFVGGTSAAGDYVVIASTEKARYLPAGELLEANAVALVAGDMSDMLTTTAQSAGWDATMYDAGSGSAIVLTSPVIATKTAWGSAGAGNVAVVDSDSITLSTSKTANGAVIGDAAAGTLNVNAGANAAFVNLTIGADAASDGTVTMTGGTVAVQSLAYVGKEGAAALNVSGGSFSALNLIAATGADASADINVSGDATFDVTNLLALTEGATLTVSGYQTTVNAANLTLDKGANITFELDTTHGVGSGIVVSGNVVLKGTISAEQIGTSRVEGTYTVIRASGEIFDYTADLVDSSFVSYEIVENGNYQELQVTFFTPQSCEEVINGGFALAADMNNDCYVNIEDIAILASQWLSCNNPTDVECNWLGN